jgi:Ala-tRNA(Pro) deacylase
MAVPKKVLSYLDKKGLKYDVVKHKKVFTAFDLSKTLKEKMDQIAKTLLVKTDKKYVLVTLPASYRLDLDKVKKYLRAKSVALAKELHMEKVLKVKPGALTPFGALHKLEVLMDKTLLKAGKVLVGAGSYTESLRLKAADLHKMEGVTLGAFGKKAALQAKAAAKKAVKKLTK